MTPDLVLSIIKLSLELALEIVRSIPKEQHAEFWRQHQERMAFWHNLFVRLFPEPKKEKPDGPDRRHQT